VNVYVHKSVGLALLHTSDAPIKVGRETVREVILLHYPAIDVEGLMTHEHALAETLPRKMLRRNETTRTQQVAIVIHNVSIAIDYTHIVSISLICYMLERVVSMKLIARIKETHIIALGKADGLVHGVVKSLVTLAYYDDIKVSITHPVSLSQGNSIIL
jgi:hypothetical protein